MELVLFQYNDDILGFGLTSFIDTLINSLSEEILITLVILNSNEEKEVKVIEDKNRTYIHIPSPENKYSMQINGEFLSDVFAKRIMQILYLYINKNKEIIFLLNSMLEVNLLKLLKSYFRCKIVWVVHSLVWKDSCNIDDEVFCRNWISNREIFPERLIKTTEVQIQMAQDVDLLITVTNHAKKCFIECFNISPEKIKVIYNALPFSSFEREHKAKTKKSLGLNGNEKIIIFCGRLVPMKGVFVLIDAFKKISEKMPDFKLVLIGDGLIREAINAAKPIVGKVIFTGQLNKEEKNRWYNVADIGVLPTLAEQCSFSAIEMRFWKIPLIISDLDGNVELFTHKIDCLKIKHSLKENGERTIDPVTLGNSIFQLANDLKLQNILKLNSYDIAVGRFNVNKFRREYVKEFKHLLN